MIQVRDFTSEPVLVRALAEFLLEDRFRWSGTALSNTCSPQGSSTRGISAGTPVEHRALVNASLRPAPTRALLSVAPTNPQHQRSQVEVPRAAGTRAARLSNISIEKESDADVQLRDGCENCFQRKRDEVQRKRLI